jgi:hypothetical protein
MIIVGGNPPSALNCEYADSSKQNQKDVYSPVHDKGNRSKVKKMGTLVDCIAGVSMGSATEELKPTPFCIPK